MNYNLAIFLFDCFAFIVLYKALANTEIFFFFLNIFAKQDSWDFDMDCVESTDQFGEKCNLNYIVF
jgi:hypothetical protein